MLSAVAAPHRRVTDNPAVGIVGRLRTKTNCSHTMEDSLDDCEEPSIAAIGLSQDSYLSEGQSSQLATAFNNKIHIITDIANDNGTDV